MLKAQSAILFGLGVLDPIAGGYGGAKRGIDVSNANNLAKVSKQYNWGNPGKPRNIKP